MFTTVLHHLFFFQMFCQPNVFQFPANAEYQLLNSCQWFCFSTTCFGAKYYTFPSTTFMQWLYLLITLEI